MIRTSLNTRECAKSTSKCDGHNLTKKMHVNTSNIILKYIPVIEVTEAYC